MGVREQEKHQDFVHYSFVVAIVAATILGEYYFVKKVVAPNLSANSLSAISFVKWQETVRSPH